MIIITGVIELESAAEAERVQSVLIRRAERSRQDPGCVDYNFALSLENPAQLRLVEIWESQELLDAHLAIDDPEFNTALANARITRAEVAANSVSERRVLMQR